VQFDHVARQVPDIAEAIEWYRAHIPGTEVVYQDATWALIDAGGVNIAFVVADQHPNHLAWRVTNQELERQAAARNATIHPHRDGTRSFYIDAPGGEAIEIIAYPDDH
jgi:catechol 2,3-dioxygenase-like lactoylglutathione lyase family enzyme